MRLAPAGKACDKGLIALVLVAEELVEIVLIDVEAVEELGVAAVAHAAEDDTGDGEKDERVTTPPPTRRR